MNKREMFTGIFCAVFAAAVALPALAQERKQITGDDIAKATPSGTVDVEGEQIRLILGGSSGRGVLHFRGKDYPFTFKGGTVGGIGVTSVQATGNVYFLNKVEDFEGTYSAGTLGAALVKGAGRSSFQNDKNVYLEMRGKQEGVALNLGIGVATVTFVK